MTGAPTTTTLLLDDIPVDEAAPHRGSIARITIDRPAKLNALNQQVWSDMRTLIDHVEAEDQYRVIVIAGAPPPEPEEGKRRKPHAFAAGADISEFVGKDSSAIWSIFNDRNIWEVVWEASKPTLAMVDGFALGGGMELACSCDIRIVSDRSTFGFPEINLGLMPGGGGTQRAVHLLGYGLAMELILTGANVDAARAERIGLANRVTAPEDLEAVTMEMARTIATRSAHAVNVAKATIREATRLPLDEGVIAERRSFSKMFDSEDAHIGVKAFLERTSPEWVDR